MSKDILIPEETVDELIVQINGLNGEKNQKQWIIAQLNKCIDETRAAEEAIKCIKQLTHRVFWRRLLMPLSRNVPRFTTRVYYWFIEIIGYKEWDKLDTRITHAWDSARNHSGKMQGLLRVYKKLTPEELIKLKTQEFVSKEEYEKAKKEKEAIIEEYKNSSDFREEIKKILTCWDAYRKGFEDDKVESDKFFEYVEKMKKISIGKKES